MQVFTPLSYRGEESAKMYVQVHNTLAILGLDEVYRNGGLTATFLLRFHKGECGTPHEVKGDTVSGGQPGRDERLRVVEARA